MNDIFSIALDKGSSVPLYKQLGDAVCELIEKGLLAPNAKLPPIRQMSQLLNVNNVTVISAYKYLENKKAVYSHVGSGTFVSPIPLENVPEPVINENVSLLEKRRQFKPDNAIDFTSTSMPQTLFPVDEFKASFDDLLERDRGSAFNNTDLQGYPPLRESICHYLKSFQINADVENIQILSGAQQGFDLVAKAMMTYGDFIFVEKPTFYGAAASFLSRGCQIIEIPLENDGMNIAVLENLLKLYSPKFLYLMAYFQTPTSISYSMEKKRKILELAEKYNFYIIEDDNMYDFHYSNISIIPLKALDYRNRVIYIKSFSKILMPGLRLGFAVLPKKIIKKMAEAKYTSDIQTSAFIQKAFDLYLRNNRWEDHVLTMRRYGREKYKACLRAAERHFKGIGSFSRPNGGISLWIRFDNIDSGDLIESLKDKNVLVLPGSRFLINGDKSCHIRLCFSNISDEKIDVGIRRIAQTVKSMSLHDAD